MTRTPRDARPATPRPRDPGSQGGSPLRGIPLAAVLSVVGLLIVAFGTLAVASGDLPFVPGGGGKPNASGGGGGAAGPVRTATPSNIVVVPSDVPAGIKVPGTLVYAKDGNIWLQADGKATQLTTGGNDSMPSFAEGGKQVLFVRTRYVRGLWSPPGKSSQVYYSMNVPSVMSVPATGGDATRILDGSYNPPGRGQWMAWIRQPALSPDGGTLALTTDLPNPTNGDVVLKLYDTSTKKLTDPKVPEVSPLGHQDPAWRPDGKVLAYVYNNRDGATGVPQVFSYTVATGKAKPISGPGYLHPSWSPDGKYLAVTKTASYGTDVAIINASTGAEVALLTNDGLSWAPVWSPAGDQVAFLHVDGQVVDLRMVQLTGAYGDWKPGDVVDLTQDAGLDSISRPDWFVPADQMPAATPAPAGSDGSGASANPSPS